MRLNALVTFVLLATPIAAFLFVLNREIPLAPLVGVDARCVVCDRKATRTLKRAAEEMRTKGYYIYRTSEYPGGIPAWCDEHGPSKMKENATKAYFAAIIVFAMVGTAYQKLRRDA